MTHSTNVSLLAQRVDELDRRARRNGRLATVATIFAATLPLLAWTTAQRFEQLEADEVKAGKFTLIDSEDRVRSQFRTNDVGEATWSMLDAKGKERIAAFEKRGEVLLILRDEKEQSRIGLTLDQRGNPHVILLDGTQKPRWHAVVGDEGQSSLLFINKDGYKPAGIGLKADGEPYILPAPKGGANDTGKKKDD